jgi:ATP-dependent DNA helicase RecG
VRDIIAECIAAFANADGGILILGVENDGTPSGHGYPDEVVVDFLEVPERRLRPAIRCRVQRADLDGFEILILQAPIAPDAVMVEANGFPYRVGDHVLREPQEVINGRKEAYRRVGYEQRVRTEANIGDLDLELVSRFLGGSVYKGRPPEQLLTRFGLTIPRAGTPGVTNAALLLFGKAPMIRWHPHAGIRFFRVAGKERRPGRTRNVTQVARIDPPIAVAIPEAY